MKKAKITMAEAQRHFAEKKDVSQPIVEAVNMIVPSTADSTTSALSGDLIANIHGCALNSEAIITEDQADNQFKPDENGDIFEARVPFTELDANYTKGAVVIDGWKYIGNGTN